MSRISRLNYFWNTVGVLLQNAISPLLLIAVARINGVDDSGIFSYALAIALLFWAVSIWGGRTYQVSDSKSEFTSEGYIVTRVILSASVVFASFAFCLLNGYELHKTAIIMALVIYKVIESIADVLYGVMQIDGKLYLSGVSLALKAVLGSAAFIYLDSVYGDLFTSVLGLVAINLAVILTFDVHFTRKAGGISLFKKACFSVYLREATAIIRVCAPIASVLFLSMFSLNIPRYFVDSYHGEEIGYFGILVMPITLIGLLITFLLQPNITQLTNDFVDRNFQRFGSAVLKISLVIFGAGILGLVISVVAGVPILEFIFATEFKGYEIALVIIVIGAIANGIVTLFVNVLTVMRHFKTLFYTLVLTNVLLAIVSVPIVSSYGLKGAVSLFSLINIVQCIVLISNYKKLLRYYRERY